MFSYKPIIRILTDAKKLTNVVVSMKVVYFSGNKVIDEKTQENKKKPMLTVKGIRETIGMSQSKP